MSASSCCGAQPGSAVHVAAEDRAELVGRDDVHQVGREAVRVDRDRRAYDRGTDGIWTNFFSPGR